MCKNGAKINKSCFLIRRNTYIDQAIQIPPNMASSDSDEREPLLKTEVNKRSKMAAKKGVSGSRPMSQEQLLVVGCILMCELCERLTYYSVTANVVLFCTSTLKLESTTAATVSLVFSGKWFFALSVFLSISFSKQLDGEKYSEFHLNRCSSSFEELHNFLGGGGLL